MEVIYIETKLFEKMMNQFNAFTKQVDSLCQKVDVKNLSAWMDSQDVCLRLNISPRTLQTLRDNGKLPYSQIQHKIFYKPEDVEALLTFVGLQRKEKILKSKNINQ